MSTDKLTKDALRKEILQRLRSQSKSERLRKSEIVKSKIFALTEIATADNTMFYLPLSGEVDTWEMLKQAKSDGKRILAPVVLDGQRMIATELTDISASLISGPYGTLQPKNEDIRRVSPEDIDLVITPGIAFDKQGNRLGRGKGYYDRFLNTLPPDTILIGLAFRFQIVDRLPVAPHDVPMHRVITD